MPRVFHRPAALCGLLQQAELFYQFQNSGAAALIFFGFICCQPYERGRFHGIGLFLGKAVYFLFEAMNESEVL